MVSGSLALLQFHLSLHGGRQGGGPDRGRSPVEWGDFLSVRSFVRPSVRPPLWTSGLAGWPKVGDGQMDRWTDPIGAAALPTPMKTKVKLEQGKGTADHLMPLGYLFFSFFCLSFFVSLSICLSVFY